MTFKPASMGSTVHGAGKRLIGSDYRKVQALRSCRAANDPAYRAR
jgi:hypothetical protein